jgi:hypothetical protein
MAREYNAPIDADALREVVEDVADEMRGQKAAAERIADRCATAAEAGVASKKEIRRLARETLMEPEVLQSQLARMRDLRDALGIFADTPLGEAALAAEADHSAARADAMSRTTKPPTLKPRPFAKQPVHRPRGRPRKTPPAPSVDDALAAARSHLGGEPAGTG